jgi:RNA polymerase sigma factor (sigma-70 family)
VDLLSLDIALKKLATTCPRESQIVELRYFGGLTIEETAKVLKISPATVERDWHYARMWLLREMSGK